MALDFPNPPLTNGQTYPAPNGVTYVWDGVKWTIAGGPGGGINFAPGYISIVPAVVGGGVGDATGHLLFNAHPLSGTTPLQWAYDTNGPAGDFVFDATAGRWVIRMAGSGTANTTITWDRIIDFLPGSIAMEPNVLALTGDPTVHLLANARWDGIKVAGPPTFTYIQSQAAGDMVFDTAANRWAFRNAPSGASGAPVTFTASLFITNDPLADDQTNVQLRTQSGGTATFQTVLVGPTNSGPGGTGRALYVAT